MGMQQMMGNMMNMMNGFTGRGGGMIPSGPRGGMEEDITWEGWWILITL